MKVKTKNSSATVYKNNFMEVIEDRITISPDIEQTYSYVNVLNTCVGIVALDYNLNIYLVSQGRYASNKESLEIPLGSSLNNEDILDAAKRELKEECGLIANKWVQLLEVEISGSITNEQAVIFLASDLNIINNKPDLSENDIQLRVIPIKEAVSKILNGVINECISISSIMTAYTIQSN